MDPNLNPSQPVSNQPLANQSLPNQPLHNQPLHKSHIPIIALILIIGIIFAAGGFILGKRSSNMTESTTTTATPAQNALIPNPTVDATTDWKTYTNTEASFSFKHPNDWPVSDNPVIPSCPNCGRGLVFAKVYNGNSLDQTLGYIHYSQEDKIKTIEDYKRIHIDSDSTYIDVARTTIDGTPAISYKLSGGIPPLPIIEYAVVRNGYYYTITLIDSPETNKNKTANEATFQKIISTFKFLDQNQADDTSNWKLYSYPNLGYSFKLPTSYFVDMMTPTAFEKNTLQSVIVNATDHSASSGPTDITITVQSASSIQEVVDSNKKSSMYKNRRTIIINNHEWVSYDGSIQSPFTTYFLYRGNKVYTISSTHRVNVEQIISTYQFN